jgi:hypothetical protein
VTDGGDVDQKNEQVGPARGSVGEQSSGGRLGLLGWIALFGLILPALQYYSQLVQSSDQAQLEERKLSVEHRPRVKILGGPAFTGAALDTTGGGGARTENGLPTITAQIILGSTLKLTNVGSSAARLRSTLTADGLSGHRDLADRLLATGQLRPSDFIVSRPNPVDLPTVELAPGDTAELQFTHVLKNPGPRNELQLHYLLLYENELGTLYDTYFWTNLSWDGSPFDMKEWREGDLLIRSHRISSESILRSLRVGSTTQRSEIYKTGEAERIERVRDALEWHLSRQQP